MNPTYVQLVRVENGEIWLFKHTEQGLKPHRQVKTIIEGEVVEPTKEQIVS